MSSFLLYFKSKLSIWPWVLWANISSSMTLKISHNKMCYDRWLYKPPRSRFTPTAIPTFPHPSLYVGDFNCQHVNWGYNKTSPDGENLDSWATSNNLGLLYNPKKTASFPHRWNVGTKPDLAFVSFGQYSRLPGRRVLGNFPRSRHQPSFITPPKLKVPAHSDPVKIWNFRKANWNVFLPSHRWIRWEIVTSGHIKHWGSIPGFLREPTICGQTMHPTWPSEQLCAMLR